MKNKDFGKYLIRYYQDRIDLFHSHFDKAMVRATENNIHEFRVDIKTLKAMFLFFEVLFSDEFNSEKYNKKLLSVFKNAGKIREMQVNRMCLSNYNLPSSLVTKYNLYLKEKEHIYAEEFKDAVGYFNFNFFDESVKKIKKLFKTIDNKTILKKCFQFIDHETEQVKVLLRVEKNYAVMHKIRMHMKLLSYVMPFLYEFHPAKELKKIIDLVKKSNSLIGDWHDEILLIYSLEKFAIKTDSLSAKKLISVISLINVIRKENEFFFEKIKSKIKSILKNIRSLLKNQYHFKMTSSHA